MVLNGKQSVDLHLNFYGLVGVLYCSARCTATCLQLM